MLNKLKLSTNRFDLAMILGLILALLSLIVQPFGFVNAENIDLSKISQKNTTTTEIVIEESQKGRMFPVLIEEKIPDKKLAGVITFYSSTRAQTDSTPFIAASGARVYDGMIANNCLPFGTEVKIPTLYGDKIFSVQDRMNRRYGCAKFDIWMDAPVKDLLRLGVKRADIEIYLKKKKATIPNEIELASLK
jgi:hypothetical protein